MAIAADHPHASTIKPPPNAPAAVAATPAIARCEFARNSCADGTISGINALFAGRKTTFSANNRNTSDSDTQIAGWVW